MVKYGFEPSYRMILEELFDFIEKNALLLKHLDLNTLRRWRGVSTSKRD